MIAKLHQPFYPLDQFIESFFYYTGFAPEHTVDRFLPDGNVQLIFDLTDKRQYIYDNETLREIQTCRRVWFSGFRTEPITIPSGRESEMLIVNFRKGKAFPFLNEPLSAVTNHVVDAELVCSPGILNLRDALQEAPSITQKFFLLESGLLSQYQSRLSGNPFVEFVITQIMTAPNRCSLREIARKVGYSQKHLIKIFKDHVGVTPKEFLRVIRFQRAIEEIERRQVTSWTAVAHDCGYYDQSHFIADFKRFSGLTPTQYLDQKGQVLNYVPIV